MKYQVKDPQGQLHIIEGPDGATPDQVIAQAQQIVPSQPQGFYQNAVQPVLGAAKTVYNAIANPIKATGNLINRGNQNVADVLQGKTQILPDSIQNKIPSSVANAGNMAGKAYGALSPYLNPVPTNDLGMALLPLTIAQGSQAIGSRFGADLALGEAPKDLAAGLTKLQQPNSYQKVAGSALSAANRLKPEQISAVIANPEIISDATPSTAKVSQMYQQAFDEAGMKIDDARLKFLTGSNWPLRDQEVGKAQKIVDMALDRLDKGTLTDTEAFVARTAASKIERSVPAASNPSFRETASKFAGKFDDFLENSSLPNIRNLNRLWFMANTKEAFESVLPLNKAGSPNALSTLLAARQMGSAGKSLLEGHPIQAAVKAGSGLLFSPKATGMAVQGAQGIANNSGALGQMGVNALSNQGEQ